MARRRRATTAPVDHGVAERRWLSLRSWARGLGMAFDPPLSAGHPVLLAKRQIIDAADELEDVPAVERVAALEAVIAGLGPTLEPIGSAVTPYSFRRLYASLRYALGDDPVYVAEQMGHADAGGLSMGTYAKAVRRRERLTGDALR